MNHEKIKELIFSFYDGEIDPNQEKLVEAHLRDCLDCRTNLNDWKGISGALFQKPLIQINPYFTQKVMNAIHLETVRPSNNAFLNWAWPSLTLGLAVIFLFLSFIPVMNTVSADDFLITTKNNNELLSVEDIIDFDGGSEL